MPTECPRCNSDNISAESFEPDMGDDGHQEVTCEDCEFEWVEEWKCISWYPQDDESKTFKPDEKYTEVATKQ